MSEAKRRGLLLIVSGPAGSGKTTIINKLIESGDFVFSVSATTRAPRPGEVNGVDYFFITKEEFKDRIRLGEMLEYDLNIAYVLMQCGMHCVGCPSSIGESLEEACAVHGLDPEEVLAQINSYLESRDQ